VVGALLVQVVARSPAQFPTSGPRVVLGPGENAGVIDIGDDWVAVFKMESHNHPSFIEPVSGAATGVGGILRDIFTMGARPIACLDSLRFGELDAPRMRYLVDGVVRGIGGYGNCIGIPTVGGETSFHRSYNGNIPGQRLRPRRHHARPHLSKAPPAASAIRSSTSDRRRPGRHPRRNGWRDELAGRCPTAVGVFDPRDTLLFPAGINFLTFFHSRLFTNPQNFPSESNFALLQAGCRRFFFFWRSFSLRGRAYPVECRTSLAGGQFLIEYSSNITRRINSPKRDLDHPVVTAKEDKNFQPNMTVLREPQTKNFRMWYGVAVNASQSHLAHIESPDGIHFVRPHRVLDDPGQIAFGASVLDEATILLSPRGVSSMFGTTAE